ncbi:glutathione S-transferase family protein [Hwanghaeella sp.]|uniref:glutathione S-transferase family protein n=1 Tax=Hwanghaeella sp. TaxID=2605943 RepID=UPI003CCBAAC1
MKLWHCYNSRSLRVLWALEEMGWERGADYEVETIPFPPRALHKEFLDINPLGTVPYFVDRDGDRDGGGAVAMTESTAICLYLVEKYGKAEFGLAKDHPEYGDYLNWLFQSDATLTFPTAIALRYSAMEPPERRQPQVVQDYAKWFLGRLRRMDHHMETRDYLCAGRFTIADIAVGYALHLGEVVGLGEHYTPQVMAYLKRLQARDTFRRAQAVDPEFDPFKNYTPNFTVEPREPREPK